MAFVITLPSSSGPVRAPCSRGAQIRQPQGSQHTRVRITREPTAASRSFFGSSDSLFETALRIAAARGNASRRFFVDAQAQPGRSPPPPTLPVFPVLQTGPGTKPQEPHVHTVVHKTLVGHDMFVHAVESGVKKSKMPNWRVFVLSMMAGAFVAVAMTLNLALFGHLTHTAGDFNYGMAKAFSALLFPFGLFLVLIYGVEMFTTNCMYMMTSTLEGKTTWRHLARSWAVSWLGNVVGAVGMAFLCHQCGMFHAGPIAGAFAHATELKALQPASTIFFKGIMANWLVCTATYGSLASRDMISKAATIWLPVCSFVFLGFEHSVANMFTLPAGMLSGAAIGVRDMLKNWLWSSIGNAVGGGILVGAAVYLGHRALDHAHHDEHAHH